jgi:predicted lipoprotein with Yx(FWY)xxD motif
VSTIPTESRLPAGIAVAAALLFVGCGGDDDDSSADTASASQSGNEVVAVASIADVGDVLVDAEGAALYTADQEADGKVRCTASCAETWLPLTVSDDTELAAADVPGTLATVKRPDGADQVTFEGAPLYTFADDGGPGRVTGDGLSDTFGGEGFSWSVVSVSGAGDESTDDGDSTAPSGGYGGGY